MSIHYSAPRSCLLQGLAAAGLVLQSIGVFGQTSGYAIGEDKSLPPNVAAAADAATTTDNSTAGPVRMARFSYVQGNVTWRADESLDWAVAPDNMPLKQAAQVWVAAGGRAEIQFDDGSYLRLGSGAIATLQVLFSDSEGEFTEIKLTNGLGALRIKHGSSVYQVDTPLVSIKADGPARFRIGVSEGVEVAITEGSAAVEGGKGSVTINRGDYLDLTDSNSAYNIQELPAADSWDRWNVDRDKMLDGSMESLERHEVPANVALVAGDLDAYGTWRQDATYGEVWCPRISDATWRPYYAGRWVWVNPFGWTWCSDEPWGWAPYHYGTWVHAVYGWGWCPGPVHQYWCPAVVHFSECNGGIAWCALAPTELQYPSAIVFGYRGRQWASYFSIGIAGCYYPVNGAYCIGRPFNTVNLNRSTVTIVEPPLVENRGGKRNAITMEFAANNSGYLAGRPFVPVNARSAAGVTFTSEAGFVGRGVYTPLISGSSSVFTQGRMIAEPPAGKAPVFGPPSAKPTAAAMTPSRAYVRSASETSSVAGRPVFRAPVSTVPARPPFLSGAGARGPLQGGGTPSGRPAAGGGSATTQSGQGLAGRGTPGSAAAAAAAARAALGGNSRNSSGGGAPGSQGNDSKTAGGAGERGNSSGGSSTGRGSPGGRLPFGGSGTGGGSSTGTGNSSGRSPGGAPSGGSAGGGNGGGRSTGGGAPSGGSGGGGSSSGGGNGGGRSTGGGAPSGGSGGGGSSSGGSNGGGRTPGGGSPSGGSAGGASSSGSGQSGSGTNGKRNP